EGDPSVASACTKIRDQVLEATGISLLLEAIPADRYHKTIEHSQDYQLAYHHIDYPDDSYWLWPYFDPRPTDGGRNFFNYRDDDQLASLFRDAMSRRQFAEVRRITQDIHQMLYDKMPLIPLWQ